MASTPSRRGLLVLAGIGAAALAVPRLIRRHGETAFDFAPVAGLPGFRRIEGGDASGAGFDPLVGIDAPTARRPPAAPPIAADAVCGALFAERSGGRAPDRVPVAMFSDAYCQYCRILAPRLEALEGEGRIAITWHELPILGPASDAAARLALAADAQGAYAAMQARLLRARVQPGPAYLRDLATGLGLDPDRLARDAASPEVTARIARSEALAARFGFFATPSLVVGRTAVTGALSERRLAALVALESRLPPPC